MSSNRTPAIIVAVAIIVGSSMICFSIDVVVDQRERLHKEEMGQLESIRDALHRVSTHLAPGGPGGSD